MLEQIFESVDAEESESSSGSDSGKGKKKTRRERERSVPDPPALQNLLSQIRRPLNKKPDLKTICDVTHLVVPH